MKAENMNKDYQFSNTSTDYQDDVKIQMLPWRLHLGNVIKANISWKLAGECSIKLIDKRTDTI